MLRFQMPRFRRFQLYWSGVIAVLSALNDAQAAVTSSSPPVPDLPPPGPTVFRLPQLRQGVLGPSADSIVLLHQKPQGIERHVLLENLRQPFGMLFKEGHLYVANTDGLVRYPMRIGDTRITTPPERVIDIPADRAAIWEIHPDGSGKRLLATGLRNPVSLAFEPLSGGLWTAPSTAGPMSILERTWIQSSRS